MWTNPEFEKLVKKARAIIRREFELINVPMLIVTRDEMKKGIITELDDSENKARIVKYLPFVYGKYFRIRKEIWVVQGKGDNLFTIIHELLHSIQLCEPNREGIVSYLTYRLTGDELAIRKNLLDEWLEIEKSVGYEAIKTRLITSGDCEDF